MGRDVPWLANGIRELRGRKDVNEAIHLTYSVHNMNRAPYRALHRAKT